MNKFELEILLYREFNSAQKMQKTSFSYLTDTKQQVSRLAVLLFVIYFFRIKILNSMFSLYQNLVCVL